MIQVVIPMCGEGKRFQDAGFTVPKPMIDVVGTTMIERVIDSLDCSPTPHKFIFVARKDHLDRGLRAILQKYGEIVEVAEPTQGAVSSVLLADPVLDPDQPLVIANCDQIITTPLLDFLVVSQGFGGALMVFRSTNPHHSYVRVGKEGLVTEVAEKVVISDLAVAGIYYFDRARDFALGANEMIEKNIRTNGEFYITPVYNELIRHDRHIVAYEIPMDQKHILGTPAELQIFLDKVENGEVTL